ncbi:MAG: tRNA (adenosine(37)-N6)-threonylcarbamoyltransferase complex ATPase subunit type 1 TsaE [Armatimonadetes bacterium]|nr:tRNA (adenosine(37)-N6)-threonylcarbamoyltransferase complex ATPase subunit type 1 TsaE [Candidatus Hippobium faecium]
MKTEFISHSPEDTEKLASELAGRLSKGDVILFFGDLGAGKTTFTKGLAKGLKITDYIHSPTFTLIHEHIGKLNLYHIDLYRLDTLEEIMNIGFEDYLYSEGVTVVEWSEKLQDYLPKGYIKIEIETIGDTDRKFVLSSDLETYNKMLGDVVNCIS